MSTDEDRTAPSTQTAPNGVKRREFLKVLGAGTAATTMLGCASEKVEKAMHERKEGTLKSGSGKKVTSKKQAIAIGLSEARRSGAKID